MSAPFDPYHKWLGIPADEQPASLYRLLGLRPFETDRDVIDTAADQRMRLLKTFQGGQHGALSQKLLNEISRARQRLLDPTEREAYDALLREQIKRQMAAAGGVSSGSVVLRTVKWPDGKAPATLDEFYQCVAASGILTVEEARQFHARLPAEKRPKDPKGMATELVRGGKLTKYQAVALFQGKLKYLSFGEYLILEKLGQGGMGQVMKAEHRRMKRIVALKLITGEALKNPDAIRRFQREVHAAARLIHPNIVTAFDANEHEGIHYFVMEYVEGLDLSALSKTHGPLPLTMALDYVLQAARGLSYAHGKGIVHRDIKPSNLLVDKEGTVKILDMGLARMDRGEEAHELTNTGQVLGTVDYMAPEQAMNTHTADARADIYSLGCTLYRLLTGEAVYGGDSIMQKLLLHREAPIPAMRARRTDVPAAIEACWRKMVAKQPEQRHQTMAEVVMELENCSRSGKPAAPVAEEDPDDGPIDSVTYKLNEFLSVMARESTKSVSGKSTIGFSAVAAAEDQKTSTSLASEVTHNVNGAETNPNTQVSIRAEVAVARAKPTSLSAIPPHRLAKSKQKQLYVVIACSAMAVLALVIAGIAVFSRGTQGKSQVASVSIPATGAKTQAPAANTAPASTSPGKSTSAAPSSAPGSSAAATPAAPPSPPLAQAPFSAAEAKQHQAAWAKHLNEPVEITNPIGMKLALIPPGKFLLGSSPKQMDDVIEQLPFTPQSQALLRSEAQHEVTIDRPFWLGVHEVTVGEFRSFVQATNHRTAAELDSKGAERFNSETKVTEQRPDLTWKRVEFAADPKLPVVCVTLADAQAFCKWLTKKHGRTYFIPTEAQWEYACRAGTTTHWYWGDDAAEASKFAWATGQNAVGKKSPNAFGLYDMLANVAEITVAQDNSPVWRGGSAGGTSPWFYRSAGREPRAAASYMTGFRIAMSDDVRNR